MISAADLVGERAFTRPDGLHAHERILLALRWVDWVEPSDLYDVLLDVEERHFGKSVQRDAHYKALERMIKEGRVERRITKIEGSPPYVVVRLNRKVLNGAQKSA
jgi:hypothetical protein